MYAQIYKNMNLCIVFDYFRRREFCRPYKYLITSGAISHTAKVTSEGMRRFLDYTGLKFGKRHWKNSIALVGEYEVISLMTNKSDFDLKYGHLPSGQWLDNGNYTRCYIDRTGKRNKIYHLNCNVKDRELLNYQACSESE